MANQARPVRIDDDVWAWLGDLPGKTMNDKLRGLMAHQCATQGQPDTSIARKLDWITDKLDEILETVQTVPDEPVPFQPTGKFGAMMGAGPRPRRESGVERAQREDRERQDRVRALDSIDDPSIDRSGEFVSG